MQLDALLGHASDSGSSRAPTQLHTITLGRHQREHIERLADYYGQPVVWNDAESIGRAKLIVVTRPPSGPQTDTFCQTLHPHAIVVIPFGESPSFDFLKSKLVNFGTISPSGADGPHELWWGGPSWNALPQIERPQEPLIVSCYPKGSESIDAGRIKQSLVALNLDHIVEPIENGMPDLMTSAQKIQFIWTVWNKVSRPILWIHPDAIVKSAPSILEKMVCDFAVHKWRGWEMATRTLYFGRSAGAEALLRTWKQLTESYPHLWEGSLLDQAWSLVASQIPLRTVWLPRSYHAPLDDDMFRSDSVIAHNIPEGTRELGPEGVSLPIHAARRAGRAGTPGPHLFMTSSFPGNQTALVMINNLSPCDADKVAATVERIASAFASNPGCFNHLELSVCSWQQDLKSGFAAAEEDGVWAVTIDPTKHVPASLFRDIALLVSAHSSPVRIIRLPHLHLRISQHQVQHPHSFGTAFNK